jgi:hypothetical protein
LRDCAIFAGFVAGEIALLAAQVRIAAVGTAVVKMGEDGSRCVRAANLSDW